MTEPARDRMCPDCGSNIQGQAGYAPHLCSTRKDGRWYSDLPKSLTPAEVATYRTYYKRLLDQICEVYVSGDADACICSSQAEAAYLLSELAVLYGPDPDPDQE